MRRASGGPEKPQRNWNNIPDLLRTMSVKISVKEWKYLQLDDDGKEVGAIWRG